MKQIEPKKEPKLVLKTKRKYKAPLVEVVLLDHEIALVMASESPIPPPEYLKTGPLFSRAFGIVN